MDCCNYVQPYPAHGHFYQQQQHNFYYDNTNSYASSAYGIGGGVGGAPVSDAIEANASRYNRLPPAYPTDYVYNPKEARLRKAMREQSRELSRQTILQTAITASTTGSASVASCPANTGNISSSSATGTTNFLNHPLTCPAGSSPATVSSLPGSPSFNTGNRIINPWFSAAHGPSTNHLKPVLSPRVMTVAQHQQQQHRTFDKSKEVLRKQAECTGVGAFSAISNPGYPADFSSHGNPPNLSAHQASSHESNEYCVIAEFPDGQKWHPYQNGPSPYHSRSGGAHQKIGALHPGMQSTNPHAHPGWNQFCGMPLSNVNRAPRHMVFLQEQQQSQHCSFPDEMQISYMQNKHMDIGHRLHPSYSQQQSKLQASSMSPLNMSQLREPEKALIEDAPRWESNGTSGDGSMAASMVMRGRRESDLEIRQEQGDHEHSRTHHQESRQQTKSQQQQRYETPSPSEKHKKVTCSKPLPGFHQAFGSTEIGRFSRSEFFANMVGEGSNNFPDGFIPATVFPLSPNSQIGICAGNSLGFSQLSADEELLQQILPEDCIWITPIPAHSNVSSLTEGKRSYATFLDYSHRFGQQDWLHANGNKISKDLEAVLEKSSPGFLISTRPEYINSSSTGSVNYVIREKRGNENFGESNDEDSPEPENLSSRSNQEKSSPE